MHSYDQYACDIYSYTMQYNTDLQTLLASKACGKSGTVTNRNKNKTTQLLVLFYMLVAVFSMVQLASTFGKSFFSLSPRDLCNIRRRSATYVITGL